MVSTTVLSSKFLRLSAIKRRSPIEGFGDARPLVKIHLADFLHERANLLRHLGFDLGKLGRDDLVFLFEARILDPMIETAALERIMNFPRAIGGEKHVGPMLCRDRAEFGDGDLKIRQHLEQKRLELHIGAIDLVDQQHRRVGAVGLDRLEQRTLDQIFLTEDLGLDFLLIAVLDFFELDAQHLLGIIPLVESRVGVEPFIALEPNQFGIQAPSPKL